MIVDFSRPILAIDTATSTLSLALQLPNQLHTFHQEVGNRQSALILPEIQHLFAAAQINAADLGAIVYAQGPGAFTGLRIGLGVAQGLATPFNTPLIGIPCLDAVAAIVPPHSCILAATDARMGEVFFAWYDTVQQQRLSPYQTGRAAEITPPTTATTQDVHGVGNAFALAEKPPFSGSPAMPSAADYLKLAQSGRYPALAAEHTELLYVRDKVALTAKEQAERTQGKQ